MSPVTPASVRRLRKMASGPLTITELQSTLFNLLAEHLKMKTDVATLKTTAAAASAQIASLTTSTAAAATEIAALKVAVPAAAPAATPAVSPPA